MEGVVDLCKGFKKKEMSINHKLNNYDWNYEGLTPYVSYEGDGGYWYEFDATESYWAKKMFIG
jgi:hypothetical protein